jgi:hypothetical protein
LDVEPDAICLIDMKAIQITMDEATLEVLDSDDEVVRDGRSAVVRRALAEYLKRRPRARIAEQVPARAYASLPAVEFGGWEKEQAWPED